MNMSQSYMDTTLIANSNHAKGYFNTQNYPIVPLRDVAAGGLNSTVLDLAKFAQMTFPNQSTTVLSNSALQNMKSPQVTSNSPFVNKNVGFAWFLDDSLDKKTKGQAGIIAGHNGGTALFHSEFMTLPKHKLAVVVMTNGSNEDGSGISAIANDLLQKALKAKTKVTIEPEPTFQLPAVVPTTQDALNNMPGMWLGQRMNVLLKKQDNKLIWNINDMDIPLVNRGNDTYYLDYQSVGLTDEQAGSYATLGLKYLKNTDTQAIKITQSNTPIDFAEKLTPQQVSDVWKNRLGKYQLISANETLPLFSVVQLNHDDNILIVQGQSKQFYGKESPFVFAFEVLNDQKAAQYGIGRNMDML